MALVINSNLASLNAQRGLAKSGQDLNKSMERLSTGKRINSASDAASGMAIAAILTNQVRGLNMGVRNANDAISLMQTAEGAAEEISNTFQRMLELSVQAANDTNSSLDRSYIQEEVKALESEIDRIANNTLFNVQTLLDGSQNGTSQTGTLTLQVGTNEDDKIDINIGDMGSESLGLTTDGRTNLDFSSAAGAQTSLGTINAALDAVTAQRRTLGASHNRLSASVENLGISSENFQAAESRIQDADLAEESSRLAKSQIMQQAGIAMLAQANQSPQLALRLLQ